MKPTQIKEELDNAAVFIEGMLHNFHYSDYEIADIENTIRAIYEAKNLIEEHIINND